MPSNWRKLGKAQNPTKMKASLSIFVFAAQALIQAGVQLGGDLILTFVVDEEPGAYSSFGSAYLLENGLHATAGDDPVERLVVPRVGDRGDLAGLDHRLPAIFGESGQ